MTHASGRIAYETGPGGARLRLGAWQARTPAGRGRIVLLHGRTEFIEKYAETIGELTGRGFDVRTMDWRGQGLSERLLPDPRRGHIDSFETYLDDLAWFMADLGRRDGAKPTYLLAHSMGGHIALRALLEGRLAVDGAILLAPMIDLPFGMPLRAAARIAALAGLGTRYVAGSGSYDPAAVRFEGNPLTSDRERFRRLHAAIAGTPGVALGGPTWGWLDAAFRSVSRLSALAENPRPACPVLLCAAEADTVVSVPAQRALGGRLANCTFRPIPGARHEILHETDAIRGRFWNEFDSFVAR